MDLAAERARLKRMRVYEEKYELAGKAAIAGVDEAGRGPLAGPVVAAAVVLPRGCEILRLNDSKKLTAARRTQLFDEIREKCAAVGVGIVSEKVIDDINIRRASFLAMRKALLSLGAAPDMVLVDGFGIPGLDIPQEAVIRGDALSVSIAAASVIAKVTRDRLMEEYDARYPGYGFAKHKGYPTKEHFAAIERLGLCEIHRVTFAAAKINGGKRENQAV